MTVRTPASMVAAMPSASRDVESNPSPRFDEEAARLLTELRALFNDLIESLPSAPATASQLQRATGLDMKLCWKVFRLIKADGALASAKFVPGPANIRGLVETMSGLGIRADLLERIAVAADGFERLIGEHAGDRQTFESMASVFGDAESERKESVRQRRAAFHANSHIWGMQGDVMAMAMIQRPSATDPTALDEVGLRGEYGVRRLRPTPVPIYEQNFATRDKQGREYSAGRRRPLSGDGSGVGLIPEFCSTPTPEVTVRTRPDGHSNAVVMHSEVGMTAAIDFVLGFELRNLSPRYLGEETHGWAIAQMTKPFKSVVIDLILEEGTLGHPPRPFGFMSSKNTNMAQPEELWTNARLTEGEPVRRLGKGLSALSIRSAPRYLEMIEWAINRQGWDQSRFESWRLRVEYPVVLSSVGLVYEMPPAPLE